MTDQAQIKTERVGTYDLDTHEEAAEWFVNIDLSKLMFKSKREADSLTRRIRRAVGSVVKSAISN